MKTVFLILHTVIAISLIALILLQNSKGGLSNAGGGEFYRSKRGAERIVFMLTIALSVLFFITSIINLIIH
jgi:preprotein translocase subunit SecG